MTFQNSRKRRREGANVDVKLVEIYEDLSNESDEIRLKAASDLLSRFTPDKEASDEEVEKVLQRLLRGLSSSRKAARIGFSVALTELLCQVFAKSDNNRKNTSLSVSKAIDILELHTNPISCGSGQEERDHYFGRLFGAEAFFKSSVLFQPDVPFDNWTRLLSLVFELSNKKPWMREECGYIVFCSVRDIGAQKMDSKYVNEALKCLCQHNLAKTREGVAIWLAAMDLPLSPPVEFPSDVWHRNNPFHAREKSSLTKVMKESLDPDSGNGNEVNSNKQKSGVWNPKLHFVWDLILAKLYTLPMERSKSESKGKKEKATKATFIDFWTEVVDNGLFAAASSDERKYWGFLVFIKVLNEAPKEAASLIFTKNVMRCLVNQLSSDDRFLHKAATRAAKSIQTRTSKEPEFAVPALHGLMGPTGAVNFDQLTKTKTVEKISSDVPPAAMKQHSLFFRGLILNPGTDDEKAAASRRLHLANMLQSILKSQLIAAKDSTSKDVDESIQSIISKFVAFAYFVPDATTHSSETAQPPISEATRELFRNKVMSCLNIVIGSRKNHALVVYEAIQTIRDMEECEEFGKFLIEMEGGIGESIRAAYKRLEKINKKVEIGHISEDPTIQAFTLLYSMTILQVYNGDPDAVSMLDELKLCSERFLNHKKHKQGEGEEASDTLVEILLSFASKPSQLFRRISEQVFGAFAKHVTATGLQSLLSILEAKESLAGQQELFDKQDMEDSDVEEVSGMEDSDVEMIDNPESDGEDTPSESDEDSEAEQSDEDDEEAKAELEAFDAKLAAALQTHRADKDADASSDSSDADMNDDEMEALDAQLVKVFQARNQEKDKKKDKKEARATMINFKSRVLDLLEIYVKKNPSSILALDILFPLLQLIRKSSVQQITTKATSVLREYTKLCKGQLLPTIEPEEEQPIWDLLKEIHQEAMHSGSNSHSSSCSQASLLLVKALVAHDKDVIPDIVHIYADTRKKQLLSNKCHIQPAFFSDWNNWCVSASKQLKG